MNKSKFLKIVATTLDMLIDSMEASFAEPIKQCCENNNKVIDSRKGRDRGTNLLYIRRRRKCKICGFKWSTREYIDKIFYNEEPTNISDV